MATGVVDTTIRINADTAAGVANINRMSMATEQLSRQAVPRLGAGFGSLATQAIAASGAAERLGVQGTFLSGTLSLVGSTIGMVNPALLVLTIAGTAAATMFFNKSKAADAARESLEKNHTALEKVARANNEFSETAKRLLEIRRGLIEAELLEIETKIRLAESGVRELSMWERLGAGLLSYFDKTKIAAAVTGLATVKGEEQTDMLTELIAKWEKLTASLSDSSTKQEDATGKILSAQERILALRERIAGIEGDTTRDQAGAFLQERIRIIEEQAAFEIESTKATQEMKALIIEESELRIQELQLKFAEQYPLILQGFVVDSTETAMELRVRKWLESQRTILTAEQRMARVQNALLMSNQNAFAAAAAGRISVAQAVAQATIGFATEAAAGELEAHAKVWAAEAIAAALTNPAVAATKLAAVAAATAGAAFIRSLTPTFQSAPAFEAQQQESSLTGDTAQGETRRGRTLVNQGPVTLNYSAFLTVNGHVFDMDDIFDLFRQFTEDQARSATFDTSTRSRQ